MSPTWLGRVPYDRALAWQQDVRERIIDGADERFVGLEHEDVVTVGRRGAGDLSRVLASGIPIVQTGRGGLATWHGPGQLVGYPIVDLNRRGLTVRQAVFGMEAALVEWCRAHGAEARSRDGFPGVWIGDAKVGSIGIHVRRGVVIHGFALNFCNALDSFGLFTACGIDGVEMTRLSDHGVKYTPAEAWRSVAAEVINALTPDSAPIKRQSFTEGA